MRGSQWASIGHRVAYADGVSKMWWDITPDSCGQGGGFGNQLWDTVVIAINHDYHYGCDNYPSCLMT